MLRAPLKKSSSPGLRSEDAGDIDSRVLIARIIRDILKAHEISPEFHRELSLMLYTDPVKVKDLEAAALLLHDCIESIIHKIRLYGVDIEENRIVNELTYMICRYLFG